MKTYRVLGSMDKIYYLDVEAADGMQAYQMANKADTHLWNEIETDSVIYATDVEELPE